MYAKIFTQIFDSSIAEDYEVRHVFEDFLKLADRDGVVDMTVEAVARRTNVPIDKIRKGLAVLTSPDEGGRHPEHEGRRMIPLDDRRAWGWVIVNYQHYRDLQDDEARRAYNRDAKARERERDKLKPPGEAPVKKKARKKGGAYPAASVRPSHLAEKVFGDTGVMPMAHELETGRNGATFDPNAERGTEPVGDDGTSPIDQ